MLYRSFSCIHARLLLKMQASIQMLESELDTLDRDHLAFGDEKRLRSWDVDADACAKEKRGGERSRDDILEELRIQVCQYDELLIKARELVSFQRPTDRDYKSVQNWHEQVAPLVGEDQEFLLWKEDILTLRHGREWASFDGLIEEMLHKIDCRLVRVSFVHQYPLMNLTSLSSFSAPTSRGAKAQTRRCTTSLHQGLRNLSTSLSLQ
jgi:hypothetical protein